MQPSEQVYTDLIHIVMNTEFAKGGAWNRSKIGWFWGGMTVQGVLPYYYNRIAQPGRSQIVDRCYYNTMADTEPCRYVLVVLPTCFILIDKRSVASVVGLLFKLFNFILRTVRSSCRS